jgi:hypothetical protein
MKTVILPLSLAAALVMTACQTPPPPPGGSVERGPHGTVPYDVLIEASAPGARIEVNGDYVGNAPLNLKVYGDKDGTFHDFGSYYYLIKALPLTTNQYAQVRAFQTGHMMTPEDRIPQRIYFDLNQPPAYQGGPVAGEVPGYGPPVYYGPPAYYYAPPYYGPSVRFYVGPRFYHRW